MPRASIELIEYLTSSDLVPDIRVARGLILSGRVLVNDQPVTSPHKRIEPDCIVRVRGEVTTDISRGTRKLMPAVERTGFDVSSRVCLDLGVSTGGFTQVLLLRGAARVYAVDVGYGITADEIRNDQRVVLLERTNARTLDRRLIPEGIERVVGDLSFISWRLVLPSVVPLLAAGAELLLLIKPQFELDLSLRSSTLERGVMHSPQQQVGVLLKLGDLWLAHGLAVRNILPSALLGAKGNREFFVYLQLGGPSTAMEEYETMARRAVAEVKA